MRRYSEPWVRAPNERIPYIIFQGTLKGPITFAAAIEVLSQFPETDITPSARTFAVDAALPIYVSIRQTMEVAILVFWHEPTPCNREGLGFTEIERAISRHLGMFDSLFQSRVAGTQIDITTRQIEISTLLA
jgi:hypothetical protein